MNSVSINNENFDNEVLKSDEVVLVDFYAEWCGPCKMLSPIIDEVASENDIKVCKVNVDEAEDVASRFGIMNIPTLIVFKEGEEKNRSIGYISKQEVVNLVDVK